MNDQQTAAPHVRAFVHTLVGLGFPEEVALKMSQLFGKGLWNHQQDTLLAMLASCEKASSVDAERAGFRHVAGIHSRTERAHATVFYHSLVRLRFKDEDGGKFARWFARSMNNNNCDILKALLLQAELPDPIGTGRGQETPQGQI